MLPDLPDDWVPILAAAIAAMLALIGTIIATVAAILKLRFDKAVLARQVEAQNKDLSQQLDKQIDERIERQLRDAWNEIDALKEEQKTHTAQMSAVARILRAIARQWPDEHGPDLDPADLILIEDTVPASWMRTRKERS